MIFAGRDRKKDEFQVDGLELDRDGASVAKLKIHQQNFEKETEYNALQLRVADQIYLLLLIESRTLKQWPAAEGSCDREITQLLENSNKD